MGKLMPNELAKQIIDICAESKIVENLRVEVYEDVVVKCRVFLVDSGFIDVYYNSETGRTAFALIKDNKRIFGADNTGEWHIHPFENPKEHRKSDRVDFKWFLEEIKAKKEVGIEEG